MALNIREQLAKTEEFLEDVRQEGVGRTTPDRVERITTVRRAHPLSKAEKGLIRSNALTVEDDPWHRFTEGNSKIIEPTYNPVQLATLVQQNNTLLQCVEAMEINVDGTGFDIERKDGKTPKEGEKDTKIEEIKEFFNTIFPGETFTKVRRGMRRDRESIGNGYFEVIRDGSNNIAVVGYMDGKLTRMMELDAPVEVDRTVIRKGKEVTIKMRVRERRYAQLIGNRVRYFKEFGASRELDAHTGMWKGPAGKPEKIDDQQDGIINVKDNSAIHKANDEAMSNKETPPEDLDKGKKGEQQEKFERATEVLHFPLKPDVSTLYGVPRWINQVPSVLGSRAAEELNLEYFKSGGVPPMILFLLGGQLSKTSREQLTSYLAAPAKYKQRAVIAELLATGGSVDQNANMKANVERFGGERQTDSLFEDYDENCHNRTRSAFRLPPLFVGHSQEYTFATAYASYLVAEAQVFKPERDAFDEIINATLMQELYPEYVYRSLPLQITDVANQLAALGLVQNMVDRDSFVDEVNEIASLNLTPQDPAEDPQFAELNQMFGPPPLKPGQKPPPEQQQGVQRPGNGSKPPAAKTGVTTTKRSMAKDERSLLLKSDSVFSQLAHEYARVMSGETQLDSGSLKVMGGIVKNMEPRTRALFNAYVGKLMAPDAVNDPQGMADLMACAGETLAPA